MNFGDETQAESSQRMYNARAEKYEDSWHPAYSERFMAIANVRPGERILSLACGTGLDLFIAAENTGPSGEVVGVDITDGMLAVAQAKQAELQLAAKIRLFKHDVTKLETLSELEEGSFDLIVCSSAFVLLQDHAKVIESWKKYLKSNGRVVIDITHEKGFHVGLLLERTAKRLDVKFPSNRTWIKDKYSFQHILEDAGYTVEDIVRLDNFSGQGDTHFSLDQIDEQFDATVGSSLTVNLATDDFKTKAREIFREEWIKSAVDGQLENVDSLYVYVARNK